MEPSNQDKQERTMVMQRKVLANLTESGNVSYACKRAGVTRETYYAWKKEDNVFAQDAALAINYGKSFVNDMAHTQLILNIQKGDMKAVRFQLISCHDDYKPRRALPPQEPEEEKPVPITAIYVIPTSRKPHAPSASPERDTDKKKPKPASPNTVKLALPPAPEPESDNTQFQRPSGRKIWRNDDDDGVEFDGDIIWGKR